LGEAPRGAANGIYEVEELPIKENGKIIDIPNSTLNRNNNARIDTPVFKVDNAFQGRQARKKRDALLAACDYLVFEDYRLGDKTA